MPNEPSDEVVPAWGKRVVALLEKISAQQKFIMQSLDALTSRIDAGFARLDAGLKRLDILESTKRFDGADVPEPKGN